jgi:hypothetical protein
MTAALGTLLSGVRAGERRSRLTGQGLTAPATLDITSPSFTDDAPIPARYAGIGVSDNVSPALQWRGAPDGTRQLVLILEDVDVPLPRPLLHTIVLIEPNRHSLDEGALQLGAPGLRFLPGTLRSVGYAGPRPIPGHGTHHYRFQLFALDQPVSNTVKTTTALLTAMRGHVLARGVLTGTYRR